MLFYVMEGQENIVAPRRSSLELTITSNSSIVKSGSTQKENSAPKKKILEENVYTQKIEHIIQRDFFPDLPKLKTQNEYIDALEKNDYAKLREIELRFCKRMGSSRGAGFNSAYSTPSTFETPVPDPARSPSTFETPKADDHDETISIISAKDDQGTKKKVSLDEFLTKYTSEDNASFEDIMKETARKHQQNYPWLYQDEAEENQKIKDSLALPCVEKQALEEGKPMGILTWSYKNKNHVMYPPEGAELTLKEKLEIEKRQEIVYDNTRFDKPPFNEKVNQAVIAEAAAVQAKTKEGKVGIDGKELLPKDTPQVNGYSFVATPSPAPGVTDSPLMTWGEIEGTPFRLDGSDTPLPQTPGGPHFRIPEPPSRERLALSLADKAAKQHRDKKEVALRRVQSSLLSPSPRFGSNTPRTPTERLSNMSPAAQKLACIKLGINRITDRALRASYSPSPTLTPTRDKTPIVLRTPSIRENEVTPSGDSGSASSKRTLSEDSSSLTDNLLNLHKRTKASDFF